MDMGTVGWIALGWIAMAMVVSLALGGFLRKVGETPGEDDFAAAASRQKVLRYLRTRKPVTVRGGAVTLRTGKRSNG